MLLDVSLIHSSTSGYFLLSARTVLLAFVCPLFALTSTKVGLMHHRPTWTRKDQYPAHRPCRRLDWHTLLVEAIMHLGDGICKANRIRKANLRHLKRRSSVAFLGFRYRRICCFLWRAGKERNLELSLIFVLDSHQFSEHRFCRRNGRNHHGIRLLSFVA